MRSSCNSGRTRLRQQSRMSSLACYTRAGPVIRLVHLVVVEVVDVAGVALGLPAQVPPLLDVHVGHRLGSGTPV